MIINIFRPDAAKYSYSDSFGQLYRVGSSGQIRLAHPDGSVMKKLRQTKKERIKEARDSRFNRKIVEELQAFAQ